MSVVLTSPSCHLALPACYCLQVLIRVQRFKYQTIAIVCALVAVHVGMFVVMMTLIAAQRSLLKDLYYISECQP